MNSKASHSRDEEKDPAPAESAADVAARDALVQAQAQAQGQAQAKEAPARERRASHRVEDDQKSGQGSLSALSKLKMIERKRAAIRPGRDDT